MTWHDSRAASGSDQADGPVSRSRRAAATTCGACRDRIPRLPGDPARSRRPRACVVAVIGCGLIGAAVARELQLRGRQDDRLRRAGPGAGDLGHDLRVVNSTTRSLSPTTQLNVDGMRAHHELQTRDTASGTRWFFPTGNLEWAADTGAAEVRATHLEALGYPLRRLTPHEARALEPDVLRPPAPVGCCSSRPRGTCCRRTCSIACCGRRSISARSSAARRESRRSIRAGRRPAPPGGWLDRAGRRRRLVRRALDGRSDGDRRALAADGRPRGAGYGSGRLPGVHASLGGQAQPGPDRAPAERAPRRRGPACPAGARLRPSPQTRRPR